MTLASIGVLLSNAPTALVRIIEPACATRNMLEEAIYLSGADRRDRPIAPPIAGTSASLSGSNLDYMEDGPACGKGLPILMPRLGRYTG